MKNEFAFIGGIFACLIFFVLLYTWATKDVTLDEMTCERKGVTGKTTMRQLRNPGPYVIVEQEDGDTIAIPKDGIRCRP